MTDVSEFETPVQRVEPTPNQNVFGVTPPTTTYPKSSYSPFGVGKPKAAVSDSLYSPPPSYDEPESTSFANDLGGEGMSEPTMDDNFSSFEESDLDVVDSGFSDFASSPPYEPASTSPEFTPNISPSAQTSYSPFGSGKRFAATDDSLYGPPASEGLSDSAGYDVSESEQIIASQENSALPPQNFSPFGGAKPVAPSNDPFYSPPSEDSYELASNEEESLPFAASGLDGVSGASGPETTSFRASAPKKSFSPFGTKPKAPSDTRGNGGGYLNDLQK